MSATSFTPVEASPPAAANDPVRRDVTVVIAAWRAAGTIGRAVASALKQPEAAEVVVVDDASGDDGATIRAAEAADDGSGRLKVFALPRNGGPSAARNAAIRASKAAWIAILDSDDFMEPGRLGKLLVLGEQGYDLLADDLLQVPEGQPVSDGVPMWFGEKPEAFDVDFEGFLARATPQRGRERRELGFLKPLVRRAFIERHNLTYRESMRLGEDYDLYARALAHGARMRLVPWTGYVSVMRRNSLSGRHSRTDLAEFAASDDRLLASGRLSEEGVKLVKAHRFTTHSRIVWIDFIARLKKLNVPGAAWAVLKDPRQAPYVMRGLGKIVARRMGFAKQQG
jgi:succinoglycan biosynthesis protein ExoU